MPARKFVVLASAVMMAVPFVTFAETGIAPARADFEPADLVTLALLSAFVVLGIVAKRSGRRP